MPETITSLIEKLEGAEGPSIALDAEICWTLERDLATSAFWRGAMGRPGPLPDEFSRLPRGLGMASLEAGSPNYTASLDAALALAERVLNTEAAINLLFEIADAANLGAHHISDLPRLLCARVLRAQSEARV